jgi:hypothetical protein
VSTNWKPEKKKLKLIRRKRKMMEGTMAGLAFALSSSSDNLNFSIFNV